MSSSSLIFSPLALIAIKFYPRFQSSRTEMSFNEKEHLLRLDWLFSLKVLLNPDYNIFIEILSKTLKIKFFIISSRVIHKAYLT